jgi:hypothetical protein
MKTRGIMERTGFENLRVYRLAEDIAVLGRWHLEPQNIEQGIMNVEVIIMTMTIYLAPHDNHMPPHPPRDCVAIRHPGQVPQSGMRAGIQKQSDYIELLLDSGSRPPETDSSGMTGSVNCDIVFRGRGDFR